MSSLTPRLRMFAGPNGSGKSRLKRYLPSDLLGVYLNADEIEATVQRTGYFDASNLGIDVKGDELHSYFAHSGLLNKAGLSSALERLSITDNRIDFTQVAFNSYVASALVEFIRRELMKKEETFTFETVMSHVSKVDFLRDARSKGYRTYLYYVATADPSINISRVRYRASTGGHDVPEHKVTERYYRSLDLLSEAIRNTDRAFIFDNSADGGDDTWLAEITSGKTISLKMDVVPDWFKVYVLDKMNPPPKPR